jgi:hypothetical protein
MPAARAVQSRSRRAVMRAAEASRSRAARVAGDAEAHEGRDVFGARAQAPLVPGAAREGGEGGAAADVEGADAFGRVELVAREGEQVDVEGAYVEGDLADGLGRVGVHERARGVCIAGELGDGLQHAGLVVGVNHRDEARALGDGGAGFVEAQAAFGVEADAGDAGAVGFEPREGGRGGGVFDRGGDDVVGPGEGVEGAA